MKKINRNPLKMAPLVAVLAIALIALVFFRGHKKKTPSVKETPAKAVSTAPAVQKNVNIYIDSFGNLYSPYNVDIKSQATGEILSVHFKEGGMVKKGELLFTVDPSQYKATLEKAEAMLSQDQAALKLGQDTLERNKQLLAKELIAVQDFEQYKTNVTEMEEKVRLDNADVELAKLNLNYCYITSPIDGICGKRQVDPGNIVAALSGPTLVNVKSIDPLYVDFTITEKDIESVRKAMAAGKLVVEISLQQQNVDDAGKDDKSVFTGQLKFLDNTVDNTTGTLLLRAVVGNKDKYLWIGQFVKVRLRLATVKNAVVVPYEAVQTGQKGDDTYSYVFVVGDDKKADLREVTTGNRADDEIIVVKGLAAGENVVTSGQMNIRPGTTVEIENENSQPGNQ